MQNIPATVMSVCLTVLVFLAGCEDEPREYVAPKDPHVPMTVTPPPAPPAASAPSAAGGLTWTLPEGWRQEAGRDGVTFAILRPPGDDDFVVSITSLGMDLSHNPDALIANINRWRGQLLLEPADESTVASMIEVINNQGTGPEPGLLVNLPGPGTAGQDDPLSQRMLVAMFAAGGQTWFFKAHADGPSVTKYEPAYRQLIQSVHLGHDAAPQTQAQTQPMAAENGTPPRSFAVPGLAGILPPGWEQAPNPSEMRAATFIPTANTEVAVTRLSGNVGTPLQNVNRWRQQLGLSPIADMSEQESKEFLVDGQPASVFQFAAPGDDPNNVRMVICMAPRGETTWFIKMTGPSSLIETQVESFAAFILGLHFTE